MSGLLFIFVVAAWTIFSILFAVASLATFRAGLTLWLWGIFKGSEVIWFLGDDRARENGALWEVLRVTCFFAAAFVLACLIELFGSFAFGGLATIDGLFSSPYSRNVFEMDLQTVLSSSPWFFGASLVAFGLAALGRLLRGPTLFFVQQSRGKLWLPIS